MNGLLKRIAAITLTMALVCMIGCKKTDEPNNGGNNGNNGGNNSGNEEPIGISSNEVTNNGYTIVEVEYEDESKMYFRILTPTTAEVVNCDQFYGTEHITEGYIYRNDVVVPENFTHLDREYEVVAIGEKAFYRCSGLASVSLPNTVIEIKQQSFSGCSEMENIYLNTNLQKIGDAAFSDCSSVSRIVLPNSISDVGNNAFSNCSHLESIVLPNQLTMISDGLFYCCSSLSSISIPNSVQSIGQCSFERTSITSVIIPNETTVIKSGAFCECDRLETITFGSNLERIEGRAFSSCSSLLSVELPDNVLYVGDYCFSVCTSLRTVRLSANMTAINKGAFASCSSLSEFDTDDNITTIGEKAFYHCESLAALTIGKNMNSIAIDAFESCFNLEVIYYNAINCENIGHTSMKSCFSDCPISDLVFGESVVSIPSYLFTNCNGIFDVYFPNSLVSIGDYAFNNCHRIRELHMPNSVVSIGNQAFCNCQGIREMHLSNSLFHIGNSAFLNCYGFEGVLDIPSSVNEICTKAFGGCENITHVSINSSLSICDEAFSGCSGLTTLYYNSPHSTTDTPILQGCSAIMEVIIGESVEVIPDNAFKECSGSIVFENAANIREIGLNSFMSCQGLPSRLEFENAYNVGSAFSFCDNIEYIVLNSVHTYGSNVGKEYLSYNNNLKEIYFGENIEQFWGAVLNNCPSLTSITCAATIPPSCICPIIMNLSTTPAYIYVPAESVEAYKNHEMWGRLKTRIRPIP